MNRVVLHSSLWDSRARGMWCRGRDFVGSDSTSRTPSTPCHSGLEAYEQRPVRPYFKEGALCTPKPEVSHLSRGEKPARQPQPTPSRSRHLLFHVHSRPATCTNPAPKTGIYIPPAHCSFPQRTPTPLPPQASEIPSTTAHTTKTDQRRPRGRRIRQGQTRESETSGPRRVQPSIPSRGIMENNMETKQETRRVWSSLLLVRTGTVSASSRGALGGHSAVETVDGAADATQGEEDLLGISAR